MEFLFTALGCLVWTFIAAIIVGILFLIFAVFVYIRDQRKQELKRKEFKDKFENSFGKMMDKFEKY